MPDFLDALEDELRGRASAPATPSRRRRQAPRHRRLVVMGAAVVAVAVGVAGVVGTGDDRLSLVDRAIAATSGTGVVHWVTVTTDSLDGETGPTGRRTEGWARGSVQHVVSWVSVHGRLRVDLDRRSDGRRVRVWSHGSGGYATEVAPRPDEEDVPTGDPFAAFRDAHVSGRLVELGGGRFRVEPVGGRGARGTTTQTITYELDRTTGLPRRQIIDLRTSPSRTVPRAHHFVTTIRYIRYELLPDSPASRRLLDLLPHPRG